jgi:hypothetical protein
MWEPQSLATQRASTACIGITLPTLPYFYSYLTGAWVKISACKSQDSTLTKSPFPFHHSLNILYFSIIYSLDTDRIIKHTKVMQKLSYKLYSRKLVKALLRQLSTVIESANRSPFSTINKFVGTSHSAEQTTSAPTVLNAESQTDILTPQRHKCQESHRYLFLIQDKGMAYPPSTSQSALIAEACLAPPLLRPENKYGGLQSIRVSTRQSFVATLATTKD